MSIGRKLLIGFGGFIGLSMIAGAASPHTAAPKASTAPVVLSAQTSRTPTPEPSVSSTPSSTPAMTPAPTPIVTPKPAATSTTTSSGSGYTNSDGNYVPSPTHADSPPAGATAQCADGTYSFSQHRSGTCSHHGGVAVWL